MAEVSQGYEAAIRRGREYAAAGDWPKALTEFIRAAQMAPTDIVARYHLAYALLKMQRYDQALQQFEGIVRIQPQHTDAWQRTAELYQQTGHTEAAVQTYRRVLDIHKKNQRFREASEILRLIIQTDPGQLSAYTELMDLYKGRGDRKNAALLAVRLGKYHLDQSRTTDARSALREAIVLFPGLPEVEELKNRLGATSNLPAGGKAAAGNNLIASQSADEYTISQLIASAEEALARGETGLALQNYEMAVEVGANRADVYYSIGQLYAQTGQIEQATDFLRRATADHDYAASAFYSMGQVYSQAERWSEAANAYRDALNMIDLQTIGREEVDELIAMNDALGDVLEKMGRTGELAELYNRLAGFITSRNLRTEKSAGTIDKARDINHRLRAQKNEPVNVVDEAEQALFTSSIRFGTDDSMSLNTGGEADNEEAVLPVGLASAPIGSFAVTNGTERPSALSQPRLQIEGRFPAQLVALDELPSALPYVRAAEQFLQSHRLYAATDACMEMIRYFPGYLPSHAILAEVQVSQNRLEPARTKYQFIVDTYQLRQQPEKSIECYKRLSEISPDNLGLHSKLANLLMQYGHKEEAAEVLLATIDNFVNTGQVERALDECKKLKTQAPQSAAVSVQYAELLIRLQRYSEALPELKQALELDPENPHATALVNITFWLIGDVQQRWYTLQTVIEIGRQDPLKLQAMVEEYRQALQVFNNSAGIAFAYACLLIESKQGRPAIRVLQQALEQAKSNELEPLLRWQLGELYLDLKEGQSAVTQLSQAARLIEQADPLRYAESTDIYGKLPSQVWVYCKLANAYEAQGNSDLAIEALQSVKKMMPYNRAIHKQLAELNFNQGQIGQALAELNELAGYYKENDKFEEMLSVLREMVDLAPNNIEVRDKLSDVFLKRDMIEEGLKALDDLAELQRKNGRLKDAVRNLQRAAEINRQAGRTAAAYELYQRIVRISPGDVSARQQLVEQHLAAGEQDEAAEELRTIAQICLQASNSEGAVAALRQVISLTPQDNRSSFQLASILTATGEYGQAYRLYEQVVNFDSGNDKARNLMEQARRKAAEAGQI